MSELFTFSYDDSGIARFEFSNYIISIDMSSQIKDNIMLRPGRRGLPLNSKLYVDDYKKESVVWNSWIDMAEKRDKEL